MVKKILPNAWQMMIFLNPLNALIPKSYFHFLPIFGPGSSLGLGVRLGRILGGPSIEPFLGEGGGLARGLYAPPPPPGKEGAPLGLS